MDAPTWASIGQPATQILSAFTHHLRMSQELYTSLVTESANATPISSHDASSTTCQHPSIRNTHQLQLPPRRHSIGNSATLLMSDTAPDRPSVVGGGVNRLICRCPRGTLWFDATCSANGRRGRAARSGSGKPSGTVTEFI
ncbi:hypothetical protein B0T16DRAFT_45055 [Cercophora newfieldiana]|uniref:Uncharacterized protein n=1 Tax=Cercophora newfieldiana TaxID=92897 RepID=A0AA39YSR6_9PEZI|nr:hypothetical protein B0T16DRAFT_45055 [Cercophora newfieldiana]